jgi:hypothetical protein
VQEDARRRWSVSEEVLPVRVAMGRSFESVRMGPKDVSDRRLNAGRALKKEDQFNGSCHGKGASSTRKVGIICLHPALWFPQDKCSNRCG